MVKRAERRDERTYTGRNLYPKWAYFDAYGEKKYAYTRARAREYNKAVGVPHPYHQETVRRFHRQEYEAERERILGPTRIIDIVHVESPGEYAASFGRSRIAKLDGFIREQQTQLVPVYRAAYAGDDDEAMYGLRIARDSANALVASRDFDTEPARRWKEIARAMRVAEWFMQLWSELEMDHDYWYWGGSIVLP